VIAKLERAKSKRERLHEERVQSIDSKSKEREKTALRLQQDFVLDRVMKAQTEESIRQAQQRRERLALDKRLAVEETMRQNSEAIQRKEGIKLNIVSKCRAELAVSPILF